MLWQSRAVETRLAQADAWLEMSGAKSYELSSTSSAPGWLGLLATKLRANANFAKRIGCSRRSAYRFARRK